MSIQRYSVIETALCIGEKVLDGEVEMVLASEYDSEMEEIKNRLLGIVETLKMDDECLAYDLMDIIKDIDQ